MIRSIDECVADLMIKYDTVDQIMISTSTTNKHKVYCALWNILIQGGYCDIFDKQVFAESVHNDHDIDAEYIVLRRKLDNMAIFIIPCYERYVIHNIIAMCEKQKHIYPKYRMYCIGNKQYMMKKLKKCGLLKNYMSSIHIGDMILDDTLIHKYFKKFKNKIENCD